MPGAGWVSAGASVDGSFTAAVLLLPLPCLFHRAFVERVVVPFLQAFGAA